MGVLKRKRERNKEHGHQEMLEHSIKSGPIESGQDRSFQKSINQVKKIANLILNTIGMYKKANKYLPLKTCEHTSHGVIFL